MLTASSLKPAGGDISPQRSCLLAVTRFAHGGADGRRAIKISLDLAIFAVICGILPLLVLPRLPEPWLLWPMLFVACLLLRTRWPICRYLACLGLGFLWAVFNAGSLLGQMERLSHMPDVTAVAQVSSVALKPAASKQTLMRIERVDGHWLVPALAFTTTWVPERQRLCAGQRWQLKLRLRPVHGKLNEGGFDSQRWAIAQRQPLTAQVRQARLLDGDCGLRQRIISHAETNIGELRYKAVLLALAFGERTALEQALRTLMLKTGIAHLMAISGLHVAMVAILFWAVLRALQFFFPPI